MVTVNHRLHARQLWLTLRDDHNWEGAGTTLPCLRVPRAVGKEVEPLRFSAFFFLDLWQAIRERYEQSPVLVRLTNARPVASRLTIRSWLPARGLERHNVKVAAVVSTPVD